MEWVHRWMDRFPLGKRLAAGAFWTLLGSVAARILTLPISVILARWMGPAHYGELGIIQNSVDFFSTFAGFGLGLTATKHVAELRTRDPERAGRILGLSTATAVVTGVVVAVALFVLAPQLAARTLSAPHLAGPLRIGAALLFFAAITSAQSGALYGFEAFKVSAHLQAIVGFLNLPFMLGGYLIGGLKGILWGMVAAKAVEWILKHRAVRAHARSANIRIEYHNCRQELGVLWKFSLPALISGALVAPVYWACSAILVNRPNGYTEMGIFNAANQWYGALLFLPVTLGTSLLPLLSDRLGEGDTKGSAGVLGFMLRLNALIMVPVVVGMSLFSPFIMRMYGPAYSHAWPTLIAVMLTAGLFAILMPVGDVLAASGRMWLGCGMNAGWAVVFITSTLLFVHAGTGSFGLASARLLSYTFHAIWTFWFAYTVIRKNKQKAAAADTFPVVYQQAVSQVAGQD